MYELGKILLIAMVFVVSLGGQSYAGSSTEEATSSFLVKPKVRMNAPDFSLRGGDGKSINLQQFSGKIVLLNFWATWCATCREEMPALENLWKKLREKGVVIVAIAADRNTQAINSFVKEHNITFPVLYDTDGKTRNLYEITALPTSYIIGRDGKFTAKIVGKEIWVTGKGYQFLVNEL